MTAKNQLTNDRGSSVEQQLQSAIQLHQTGQIEQAQRAYRSILAQDPNHPDALHLSGLAALQQGFPEQAVESINRAIALRPSVAVFHLNLAEAYRTLGQLERAVGCCRMALRLQPDFPEAVHNLGWIFTSMGRTEDALAQFRQAVRLRPDFALAHNSLANALRELGDLPQALEHFRRAGELEPERAEFRSNLGQLLLERGEPEEALEHCRAAVRLLPNMPEARCNLGNVLRELGQLTEAKACYIEALRLNPDLAMVHNNMGQALQEEGELDEAVTWYEHALQMEPNVPRFLTNLADVLTEQEKFEEALVLFERALRHDPAYVQAHSGLGALLRELGRPEEARQQYREALRLKPDLAGCHCALGDLAEELGDKEAAEAGFREALKHSAKFPGAYAQLATLLRGKLPAAERQVMLQLLDDPKVRPLGRANLLHGLAQVYDATGDFAAAADCLQKAKAIQREEWGKRRKLYEPAEHHQYVEQILAQYTPEFFARTRGWGLESERPIFIFGLPRSGTTLVEQVLASHSQVYGAGELRLAQESFRAIPDILGQEIEPFDGLDRLETGHVRRLAQRHLDRLAEMNRETARITDKMPDNYLHLGLLATLFPRATFIHCRRDLRDIAVSCWMTNFRAIRWNLETETIASRFQEYRRVMDHWRRVLPVSILEVQYEETVDDLEKVARRLVEACRLEWEPRCLEFHRHDRPVRTASVNQVRRPVYKTSVARWKHYEPALGPLFAKLRD